MKVKVDEELDKLIEEGVIIKTDHSSLAPLLMTMLKYDGSVRFCADYRVTVNFYLENIQHLLPRIDKLFQALQGNISQNWI